MNYYNENDPKAAAWLRELINAGLIAPGVVDERSIIDVLPTDLHDYKQCHFFAGIGGWSYALRLAGIPDDEPVWTGSCPCQPFSVAGQQLGTADVRHLWPVFFNLIRECRPAKVFGEQVASKAGRDWLTGVFADLESVAYAGAGADLCAAGVGAPHIRQRLYWVANPDGGNTCAEREQCRGEQRFLAEGGGSLGLGNALREGREGQSLGLLGASHQGHWSDCEWLPCTDGKQRRIESGTFPLANGIPGRVGLLRGYGNAIVPQVAAQFIQACYEAMHDVRSDVLMSDPMF